MIRRYAKADGIQLRIQFDLVRRHNADGNTDRYMFAEANVVVSVGVTGALTVTPNPPVSEESRQKLIADAAEKKMSAAEMSWCGERPQRYRIHACLKLLSY